MLRNTKMTHPLECCKTKQHYINQRYFYCLKTKLKAIFVTQKCTSKNVSLKYFLWTLENKASSFLSSSSSSSTVKTKQHYMSYVDRIKNLQYFILSVQI